MLAEDIKNLNVNTESFIPKPFFPKNTNTTKPTYFPSDYNNSKPYRNPTKLQTIPNNSGYYQTQPIPYANQPNPYVKQPNSYANQPNPYVKQPNPYANQPNPYANQPNPYASKPNAYANQSNPYVNQPNPYVNQPNPYASQQGPIFQPRPNTYKPQQVNPIGSIDPPQARFFVIKSLDEDNIHKGIKFNIWCSTMKGNQKLQKAYRESGGKYPIFLLFSY